MIFLADENIHLQIIAVIEKLGFTVNSIYLNNRGLSDMEILALAFKNKMIIITEDKDFGELVFKNSLTNVSVIFLRYHFMELKLIIKQIEKFILNGYINEEPHYTTITTNKIRHRKL
jgi:predicted nuclease of predicted toxin-antitoxin system